MPLQARKPKQSLAQLRNMHVDPTYPYGLLKEVCLGMCDVVWTFKEFCDEFFCFLQLVSLAYEFEICPSLISLQDLQELSVWSPLSRRMGV